MTYKWLPAFTEQFRSDIDNLPRKDRMIVFQKMAQLLNADDPTDMNKVTDIKPLVDPIYAGAWRKRAGTNRIIYRVNEKVVIEAQIEYNGEIIFEAVIYRRDL